MNYLITIPAHEVTSLAHGVTTDDDMEASQDDCETDRFAEIYF
jgi:hypothetical protein